MAKQNKDIEAMKSGSVNKKKQRMETILNEMQVKLSEIDSLRKELQREKFSAITPKESKSMLEEIKVPSIQLIKESKKN